MSKHDDLLRARYGEQPAPTTLLWNDQVEALLTHRSVRAFTNAPLPEGALETIVAAAQSASSSSNLHQWSVIAVSEPATKRELAKLTRSANTDRGGNDFIADAPLVLLWVADMSRNHAISTDSGGDPAVTQYLDAFLMASVDAALAAQNGMVAAESLGLGGVYLGSLRNHAEDLADLVDLPPYAFVVFGTAIGIPDQARPSAVRPRPAQDVVLHREKYDRTDHGGWVQEYEAATTAFRTENGLKDKTWTEAVVTGTGFEYMGGREKLRPMLQSRGFGLR